MKLSARYLGEADGAVEVGLTDGSVILCTDPDRDERLSRAVDHPVTLWPRRPASDLDHYRRGSADHEDLIDELRAVFGREPEEPLPDLSVFPPEILEYESPPGTYVDAFPLLVMSTSALRSLERALPESAVDVRRFRPNVVVDTGGRDGHPELEWAGMRARVGSATIELTTPCPRCVMVTHAIDDGLPADRSILRHIVRESGPERRHVRQRRRGGCDQPRGLRPLDVGRSVHGLPADGHVWSGHLCRAGRAGTAGRRATKGIP